MCADRRWTAPGDRILLNLNKFPTFGGEAGRLAAGRPRYRPVPAGSGKMPAVVNHLIELLPRKDRLRLLAISEPVELSLGEVIGESGAALRHVYFPTSSFVSLITPIDGKPVLEVGLVGREGMVGSQLVLGIEVSPFQSLVQGGGTSWRIATRDFSRELGRSKVLQHCLKQYLYVLTVQLANTAACTHFHLIGQRLARWLLMTQDRADSKNFHVTHEGLAYMLGVRRVGVTNAAHGLQRRGLINYRRGEMTVVDRRGLEAEACSCYATDLLTYAQLMKKRRGLPAPKASRA